MKLLSKDEYNYFSINEAAVDWDDSLLGKLTKGTGSMLSFLSGSIKKGISKQKIKSLCKQWTAEYARVVREVYDELQMGTVINDDVLSNTDNYDAIEYDVLTKLLNQLNQLNQILDGTIKWDFSKLDLMSNEWRTFVNKLKHINIEYVDIRPLVNLLDNNEYLRETHELVEKLNKDIEELSKNDDVKRAISTFQGINKISNKIKEMYKLVESLINSYTVVKKEIDKNKVLEGMIFEKEYKLPKELYNVVSEDIILELSKRKDIKKLTNEKLNYERLNTIMYNYNYIIEKEKNRKNDVTKLQRIWDLNYQHTNDYFQSVIDINTIKKQVTGKVNNPIEIKRVESETKDVDDVISLGGTDVAGGNFNNKLLYIFVGKLQNYARKEKKVKLLLSPINNFSDEQNGHKIFWFKVFGDYTINKKNQIIRKNPFLNLTQNKFLLDYGENVSNSGHFYVGIEFAITIGKPRRMYLYHANDGGVFMDNDFYKDVDKISKKIITVSKNHRDINGTVKELGLRLNIFKFNILQRFNTDAIFLVDGKYPGINKKDVENDNNIDKSKDNHKKIIGYIKNNLKK